MVNDADGSMYTMRAVYVEVRRPDRLVWTEPDAGRPPHTAALGRSRDSAPVSTAACVASLTRKE